MLAATRPRLSAALRPAAVAAAQARPGPVSFKPSAEYFRIPDVLNDWPWKRRINPHYEQVKAKSERWTESFKFFDQATQITFNKGDYNRFAALCYPDANKERLRTGCDFMNLIFVFDDKTDFEPTAKIEQLANIISSALRNPHAPRPKGEDLLGEMTRQFWERALPTASLTSQKRFVNAFEKYVFAVVQESEDRTKKHVRSIDSYMQVRRDTVAMMPAFALLELGMDLPQSVIGSERVKKLTALANEMIFLSNDICSFNVEQARDDDHNIVAVVQHQLNTDIQGAMNWVGERYDAIKKSFLEERKALPPHPSSSPSASQQLAEPQQPAQLVLEPQTIQDLHTYVEGLGNFARGNHQWCFESQRYFGELGRDISTHGWVELLPKVSSSASTTPGVMDGFPSASASQNDKQVNAL